MEMLDRYFQSPVGFRLEVRNIDDGWALDGLFAIPLKMINKPNFARIAIDGKHPLERMSLALSNGFIEKKLTTELIDQNNWVYCKSVGDTSTAQKYAWLYNQIDDHFYTSVFPCWIPGDIEKMILSALTLFYQYNDIRYDQNDNETHKYKIAMSSSPKSDTIIVIPDVHFIMITDDNGEVLLQGEGKDLYVAAYDLYEKAWVMQWTCEAPTITELKEVLDIQNTNEDKILLMENARALESEYPFYSIGNTPEYAEAHCYRGKFKFIEGEFEVFERPLNGYNKEKVGGVKQLMELIKLRANV
jgi:hypothetical protein